MPASKSFFSLQENGCQRAKDALGWRKRVRDAWGSVSLRQVSDTIQAQQPVGAEFKITAYVSLGSLRAEDVRVQALVGTVGANRELQEYAVHDLEKTGEQGDTSIFEITLQSARAGHQGYICRVVPHHDDVKVATELPLVCWQHVD